MQVMATLMHIIVFVFVVVLLVCCCCCCNFIDFLLCRIACLQRDRQTNRQTDRQSYALCQQTDDVQTEWTDR